MPRGRGAPHELLTTGARWRDRRNDVIVAAKKNGCTTSLLADVFDLSRSRIRQIVRDVRAEITASDCSEEA